MAGVIAQRVTTAVIWCDVLLVVWQNHCIHSCHAPEPSTCVIGTYKMN